MKFTRKSSVEIVFGIVASAGALLIACGGDDAASSGDTTGADASTEAAASSGGTTSSGGASSTSSSSSGGTSSGGADGGDAAAKEAGGGDAGTIPNGGSCKEASECQSGQCWKEDYCTIACTMKDQTDPVCQALKGDFTGKCNKQGFCQKD
jgi:hypothetical protein